MTPPPGAGLEGLIEWLTTWPDDLLGRIRHAGEVVDWVLGGVSSVFRQVVDDLRRRAEQLWEQICHYTEVIVDWFVHELLPGIWAPVTLYRSAQTWTDDVFSKVTSVHGQLGDSRMRVDDYWHGPAQRAYVQELKGQQDAANAVSGTVGSIHDVLVKLSLGLGGLYIAVAAACALAAVEVEGGTAALFGVITIPAGLAAIITGLLTLIAAIGGGVAAWQILAEDALTSIDSLRTAFNDNRALDRGAWPKLTADYGDGAMTDGDRSDWTFYNDPTN